MEINPTLKAKFLDVFRINGNNYYFSPGRINLIGEHTDYNGGHVFPASITYGTYGVATPRKDKTVSVYSTNFEDLGVINFEIDQLVYDKKDNWANYVKGMILKVQQAGYSIDHGFDLLIEGNIPNGTGLSSSASLELLIGVVLEDLFNLAIDRLTLVQLGQKVENEFIGVNSGIMDQFAVGFGEQNQAILLDTNTLDYEMVPVQLNDYAIVIMNTNKRRELSESKYNERRNQCEEALNRLQQTLDIPSLGALDTETFEKNRELIGDDTLIRRARHAVTENQRTLLAKKELVQGNLTAFGKLLNASHHSLRFDYEVTGIELDTLVDAAQKQPDVLGARMTGAGFGGCAIALVKETTIPTFKKTVHDIYKQAIGYAPEFYVAHIGPGTQKIDKDGEYSNS
ncbi:galactokinase [Enterococcus hermanniensis]|uniref:Galactokinase n=1 Tax=Enterococcus hermanniensis TaxID=249189 RepID=A0A1L8TP63_9ENTE|nr:galactokinase [Enterococcus hermanniensis]OJG46077.1 galactokinase [Enterococcus hermanniensis]